MFVDLVILLAGIILGVLIAWLRGFRGHRIVIYRDSQTPQISIEDRIGRALSISYKDVPVRQLVLNRFRLWNAGTSTISDLKLSIVANFEMNLEDDPGIEPFIEVEVEDPDGLTTARIHSPLEPTDATESWEILVKREHLNPKRAYKEEQVELSVFSSHTLAINIEGGGPKWRSSFRDGTKLFYFLPIWAMKVLTIWMISVAVIALLLLVAQMLDASWFTLVSGYWFIYSLAFAAAFITISVYAQIRKRF